MTNRAGYPCIALPCSASRLWLIPQICLGEIVTLATAQELPPAQIFWRGELVPVVDFGAGEQAGWRDSRTGSGLVAVILGQEGQSCRFWGLALRGAGLGVVTLAGAEPEDLPEALQDYACAAFRLHETVYQIPDLAAVQRAIGEGILVSPDAAHGHQLEQ